MIKYGNRMIADAGNYIENSKGARGFSLPYNESEEYTEKRLKGTVEKRPYNSYSIGGVFNIKVSENPKKDIITKIWSNDDQIAIILNKDDGGEEIFDFMQRWRTWAGTMAKKMAELA